MDLIVKYGGGDHEFGLKIDTSDLPPRGEVLEQMSRPVAGVHRLAKRFPKETIAKALSNEPFEDYPRAVYASKLASDTGGESKDKFEQSYIQAAEDFLRRTFHSLTFIPGISFDVRNVSLEAERQSVEAVGARYLAANMPGQLESLEEAYDGLCALRTVFQNAILRNCFSLEIVVPSRYLPEILVVAPVWFIEPKKRLERKSVGSESDIVRYFCDLSSSDQFAYLFQMYNRVPRYFDEFSGRDVMPLPIAELISQVKSGFDYLVIATPYHDLSSAEWHDTFWTRNIDPFLFGFLKHVPELIFFLGRWSQTGLFPLTGEMIAGTMERIRKNRMLLRNFGNKGW